MVAAAMGCGADDGASPLPTEEMGLFVLASATADFDLDVIVQFTSGDPALPEVDFIGIAPQDRLQAALEGSEQVVERNDILPEGLDQYRTRFSDVEGGDELTVALDRQGHTDAPSSRLIVPSAFELDDPGPSFPIAQGLRLTWSGGGTVDACQISLSSDCLEEVTLSVSGNPGKLEIASSMLRHLDEVDPSEPCPVRVLVLLERNGQPDPAFGRGGKLIAAQIRGLELTAVP
jgi:hypothetical protein